MTTHLQQKHFTRLAIAGAFLFAGLTGTLQAATAGSPLADSGGPGGGGDGVADRPIFLEHFGLVATNDPSAPITAQEPLDGPSLVGSGPEREIVANSVAEAADGTLDESKRSQDLAALGEQSSTVVVAPTEARFGQAF